MLINQGDSHLRASIIILTPSKISRDKARCTSLVTLLSR
uniref:Uncharacterized protein n=1 Tax=Brassica oleracea TaxID=3712 RepID=A0A3P6C507_BRAOL|nr:unnamed protein product [Brassica oleracea]